MSNQEVSTPRAFIAAVEKRFGKIAFDLAAHERNSVAGPQFFGPGSENVEDALSVDWFHVDGLLWLNPPFKRIEPWVEKCATERRRGARIALLAPASICTGWFIEHVRDQSYVFELTPRVFAKEIRDCILALYTPEGYVGRETWKWR